MLQEVKPDDLNLRKSYAETMLDRLSSFDNLLVSDEAVSTSTDMYWSSNNLRSKHERPLHSPKVTAWAAISAKGIIRPYC
nr:unnamed protein product [Callosobruchus chinensis]